MNDMEFFQQLIQEVTAQWIGLPDKPEENPCNTVRALWLAASGQPMSVKKAEMVNLPILDGKQRTLLKNLIKERLSGTPLAYLTGRQWFMGLDLLCTSQAMIPRRETEILGLTALSTLQLLSRYCDAPQVMDLCTGSGNLLLTVLHYVPSATGFGVDLSPEAIELAVKNSEHLGIEERVEFLPGDLFAPFESVDYYKQFDLITCNPPYISSKKLDTMESEITKFEPHLSFDGGPFGVKVLTRLIKNAPRFLKAGSWLCFEVGLGQADGIAHMLKKNPDYKKTELFADQQGQVRAIAAQV